MKIDKLGQYYKEMRIATNQSRYKVAKSIGVDEKTLKSFEDGESYRGSFKLLEELSLYYGLDKIEISMHDDECFINVYDTVSKYISWDSLPPASKNQIIECIRRAKIINKKTTE